jgi:hypothetical protein
MKRLAVKKIGRKTDKPFLSEPLRYPPLAVVEASITVHEHNRCPRIAGVGRERKPSMTSCPLL